MKLKPRAKAHGRPNTVVQLGHQSVKPKMGNENRYTQMWKRKGKQIEPGYPVYLIKMRRKHVTGSKSEKDEIEIDLSKCESSESDDEMELPEYIP